MIKYARSITLDNIQGEFNIQRDVVFTDTASNKTPPY